MIILVSPGSRRASWGSFTASGGRSVLKPVPELQTQFRELGVSNDVPVVVYGSWTEEWGEEGRIFWQLDWLGHPQVYILYGGGMHTPLLMNLIGQSLYLFPDGFIWMTEVQCGNHELFIAGIFAWELNDFQGAGLSGTGDFIANPIADRTTDSDEIAGLIDAGGKDLFLIDSRTQEEYDGSTQYNVARGGHIPGAVHFNW